MIRTALLLAAFAPFVATAGAATSNNKQALSHQELRDDLQVSALLGATVQGSDGQDVGAIEDVILGNEGRVVSVLIQREGEVERVAGEAEQSVEEGIANAERTVEDAWSAATNDRDRPTRDAVADSSERGRGDQEDSVRGDGMGPDPDRIGATEIGDEFTKVEWRSMEFDQQAGVARLTDGAGLQTIQYDQTEPLQMQGEVRASQLVGMEINLVDEESFGEVEDVLIDAAAGKASALVVDSMEFFDKERYALPIDLGSLDLEQEELTLQYTQAQVDDMEEFEMENDVDDDDGEDLNEPDTD